MLPFPSPFLAARLDVVEIDDEGEVEAVFLKSAAAQSHHGSPSPRLPASAYVLRMRGKAGRDGSGGGQSCVEEKKEIG